MEGCFCTTEPPMIHEFRDIRHTLTIFFNAFGIPSQPWLNSSGYLLHSEPFRVNDCSTAFLHKTHQQHAWTANPWSIKLEPYSTSVSLNALEVQPEVQRYLSITIYYTTNSTAEGGGGSFKNRKPIGEIGLLWAMDGRAQTLMDRTVQVSHCVKDQLTNWLTDQLPNWLID